MKTYYNEDYVARRVWCLHLLTVSISANVLKHLLALATQPTCSMGAFFKPIVSVQGIPDAHFFKSDVWNKFETITSQPAAFWPYSHTSHFCTWILLVQSNPTTSPNNSSFIVIDLSRISFSTTPNTDSSGSKVLHFLPPILQVDSLPPLFRVRDNYNNWCVVRGVLFWVPSTSTYTKNVTHKQLHTNKTRQTTGTRGWPHNLHTQIHPLHRHDTAHPLTPTSSRQYHWNTIIQH